MRGLGETLNLVKNADQASVLFWSKAFGSSTSPRETARTQKPSRPGDLGKGQLPPPRGRGATRVTGRSPPLCPVPGDGRAERVVSGGSEWVCFHGS